MSKAAKRRILEDLGWANLGHGWGSTGPAVHSLDTAFELARGQEGFDAALRREYERELAHAKRELDKVTRTPQQALTRAFKRLAAQRRGAEARCPK